MLQMSQRSQTKKATKVFQAFSKAFVTFEAFATFAAFYTITLNQNSMNHRTKLLVAIAMITLVGAGCTDKPRASDTRPVFGSEKSIPDTEKIQKQNESAIEKSEDTSANTSENIQKKSSSSATTTGGDISLEVSTGEAPGTVSMSWSLTDDSVVDANTKFILLRSTKEANPTHDGSTYWWRQHGTKRSATWEDIGSGPQYFRICVTDGDECTVYSDTMMLELD
jgi:hypothetical protein